MKHIALKDVFAEGNYSLQDKKDLLRKNILANRKKLQPNDILKASESLCEMTMLLSEIDSAKTVALYASRSTEPSTNLLLKVLSIRKKTILLPVLADLQSRNWARFVTLDDLQERHAGRPPEPSSPILGEDAIKDADLVIVPGLAADFRGHRLGHGGGWYDRVLLKKREDAKVFALLYDVEVYFDEEIPVEEHDKFVNGIVTEKQIIRV
ncbi:MAG: 5-formyltetrahydrofolate cyclo-ligase [Candidatus Ancillula sp.]|jgi:5-formyltetrahydrofolate cyclo-ligase|nr:5-formyltetrahydrofolate cyclo-ligase [Candidatus Ancillula sp.]